LTIIYKVILKESYRNRISTIMVNQ